MKTEGKYREKIQKKIHIETNEIRKKNISEGKHWTEQQPTDKLTDRKLHSDLEAI